jgi:DNA repair exonuclease SbcCD ATPase subunit
MTNYSAKPTKEVRLKIKSHKETIKTNGNEWDEITKERRRLERERNELIKAATKDIDAALKLVKAESKKRQRRYATLYSKIRQLQDFGTELKKNDRIYEVVDDEDNLVLRCHTTTKHIPDGTPEKKVRSIIKSWLDEAREKNLVDDSFEHNLIDDSFDIMKDGWVREESYDYWPYY